MGFIFWHYGKGFQSLVRIWKNYLWFSLEFFSVQELFSTLFAPWHRDAAGKYWRGFSLSKSFELFVGNGLSRIVGAIVRTCVIFLGLSLYAAVFVGGIFAALLWGLFPIVLILTGVWALAGGSSVSITLFVLCGALLSFSAVRWYTEGRKIPESEQNFTQLSYLPWFQRALNRLGLERTDFARGSFGSKEEFAKSLESHRVRAADSDLAFSWEKMLHVEHESREKFWRMENLRRVIPIARQWRFGYTPLLDRFGSDLIHASGLDEIHVCPHKSELELVQITLNRPGQNSVLLVAQPGTGRMSLIRFFAKMVRERRLPTFGPDTRIIHVDMDRVIAAFKESASAQAGVERLFVEVARAGNVILVLDNIHQYIGDTARGNGIPDIGPTLSKFLPISSFRMVATASSGEFYEALGREKGLLKFFEVVELDPINNDQALEVLLDAFDDMEKSRVVFTLPALRNIVRYSGRFSGSSPLPERALDLAKEVFVYWRDRSQERFVTTAVVDAFASLKTGVPLGELKESERDKLLHLENIMAERIIGQKRAVSQVAQALKKARIGASDSSRPIGSFLFLGPTGVGKTEMAKVLTKAYFGRDAQMVRFDMSEYQTPASVEQLIGSRELGMSGRLSSWVKENPYGVLLLDELEKADKGVLDLFLQVLDEGYFTDAFGDRIVFTNLIIIATSNAGANLIKQMVQNGGIDKDKERQIVDYITDSNIFRVEFLNRFDGVIFFQPLTEEELIRVTNILLKEFSDDLFKNKDIRVTFAEDVARTVVERGYDPIFGARSVKRYIADSVEARIVDLVIQYDIKPGNAFEMNAERLGLGQ